MKRCISFLILMICVFTVCFAEPETWDCPECGRKSNSGNFCGSCAHPAPWYYAPPEYKDQSHSFVYEIMGEKAVITKYTGSGGTVFIPPVLGGKPVKQIPFDLFAQRGSVKCVVIPDSVTSIESGAFYGSALNEVYIPSSVSQIGAEAFAFCGNLSSIHLDPGNKWFTVVNDVIFSKNMQRLVLYPGGKKDDTYTIPDGIKTIEAGSFTGSSVRKVIIPDGTAGIGRTAFWGCGKLTAIELPASVNSFGDYAFDNNPALKTISVDFYNALFSSLNGVLFNKDRTILFKYPSGKTDQEYTIPEGTKKVKDFAFEKSPGITVHIPSSVVNISPNAFPENNNYTITGEKDSEAEKYAAKHKIKFIPAE